jgi:hypothetical protein
MGSLLTQANETLFQLLAVSFRGGIFPDFALNFSSRQIQKVALTFSFDS